MSAIGDRCVIDSVAYLMAFRQLELVSEDRFEFLRSSIFDLMSQIGWPRYIIVINPDADFIMSNVNARGINKGWQQSDPKLIRALIESYNKLLSGVGGIDSTDWINPGDYRTSNFVDACARYVRDRDTPHLNNKERVHN